MSAPVNQRDLQITDGLKQKQQMVKSLLHGDIEKTNKFLATAAKVGTDTKLSACSPNSIIDACMTVAQLGLDLSPVLSHAYLVPYKNTVQLIVSARGYNALLARTGWKLKTYTVNDCDEFEYNIDGFIETVRFKKDLDGDGGKFKYAVALAQSPDGTLYVEVMNAAQIEKHRKVSSNQSEKPSGVWAQWFEEMALKTVTKKLVKKLPIGEEIDYAVNVDDKEIETVEATPSAPKQTKEDDLNALMPKAQPVNDYKDAEVVDEMGQTKDKLFYFFTSRGVKNEEIIKFLQWAKIYTDDIDSMKNFLADQASAEAMLEQFFEGRE